MLKADGAGWLLVILGHRESNDDPEAASAKGYRKEQAFKALKMSKAGWHQHWGYFIMVCRPKPRSHPRDYPRRKSCR